jgi:hypothetical protein
MTRNNYKSDYDDYHPSLWKKGNQHYHFHTPLEYKIIAKGTDDDVRRKLYVKVSESEILIQPISIGEDKARKVIVGDKEILLEDVLFWIPRRMIRRGPGSFKRNEDRWVHKETFYECLTRAVLKGNAFYESTYY